MRHIFRSEKLRRKLISEGVKPESIYLPHRGRKRFPIAGPATALLILLAFRLTQTFIGFNQGRQEIEDTGWPSTVNFDLSSRNVATHAATDTQAGGYGVITGTGYTTQTQSEPAATGLGSKVFTAVSWANGSATDWTAPKSIVARDNGTSKLLGAWDINGGSTVDMSTANTTLNVTPTYLPTQMV